MYGYCLCVLVFLFSVQLIDMKIHFNTILTFALCLLQNIQVGICTRHTSQFSHFTSNNNQSGVLFIQGSTL